MVVSDTIQAEVMIGTIPYLVLYTVVTNKEQVH